MVQTQTEDVAISGVVFTRNIQNDSPYYLINYDISKLTDRVTSGLVNNKMEIIKDLKEENIPDRWRALIKAVNEIELLLHNLSIDIEFAIKLSGEIVIFQVRPLCVTHRFNKNDDDYIYKVIKRFKNEYDSRSKSYFHKESFTLSDMAFWNPAEIIGDRSENLSFSLYKHLLLEKEWNKGLQLLGYKKVDKSIMIRFGNKAYIEVETAFLALLPDNINKKISKKLISFYVYKLKSSPELHDKIEFDIILSCYSPRTQHKFSELSEILNEGELETYKKSLIALTEKIFKNFNIIKQKDKKDFDKLKIRRDSFLKRDTNLRFGEKINIIVKLLNDSKKFATTQFSRMARLAFIGNQYIKDLLALNIITKKDFQDFLLSIDTIATDISKSFDLLRSGDLNMKTFLKKYGHLRPGTYDITRLPYSKDNRYLETKGNKSKKIVIQYLYHLILRGLLRK